MSYTHEFQTVDLILASMGQTRGVDAFALTLIKCERQMRRLFTHIVFQFPVFSYADIPALRSALTEHRRVYFEGFIRGFDAIYPRSIRDLVGQDHDNVRPRLIEAIEYRNKIFHGQLTPRKLMRDDLIGLVSDIRVWCCALAEAASADIGYDGFARDSFRKSANPDFWKRYRVALSDVTAYDEFIRQNMSRS